MGSTSRWADPLGRACAGALGLLLATFHSPSSAEQTAVDVALVVAVDASLSVDDEEGAAQRAGYAAAFRHPDFIRAVRRGRHGRIAVFYFEWARGVVPGSRIDWRVIGTPTEAAALAGEILSRPAEAGRGTSISAALEAGIAALEHLPATADRRVINISGDGPNNGGRPVTEVRGRAVAQGITINGLPVIIQPSPAVADLAAYYQDCVIGGEGAFLLPVRTPEALVPAVRRKLILEISGSRPVWQPVVDRATADCLAGERFRARWADRFFPELEP